MLSLSLLFRLAMTSSPIEVLQLKLKSDCATLGGGSLCHPVMLFLADSLVLAYRDLGVLSKPQQSVCKVLQTLQRPDCSLIA